MSDEEKVEPAEPVFHVPCAKCKKKTRLYHGGDLQLCFDCLCDWHIEQCHRSPKE